MKKNLFFAIAITATMLFTSCYQVCYENPLPPDRPGGQTVFTGTVGDFSTRITTNEAGQSLWSSGDAIGIFALPTGGTLAGSTLTANNHRFFTNVASGIFTPAIPTADNQIILPPTGNFDFIAYHPHTTPLTGNVLSVNVATTTNPSAALDLLWTRAINPVNTPVVPLAFERRMSQIRLEVRAAQPTATLPLSGLTAEIDGVLVNATMNLEDGVVAASTAGTLNATSTVTAAVVGGYDIALTPWLFVPPQTLNDVYVTLKTSEREWEDIPVPSQALLPGLRYNIVINVNADGSRTVIIQDPTNIPGWQDGGNIYVPGVQTPTPPPPGINVSDVALPAIGAGVTSTVEVEAPIGQAWTVEVEAGQTWLTVVNTGGIGDGSFGVTATPNTGGVRSATVTIEPTAPTDLIPVTITVTQAAAPTVTTGLLFPGSNFADWGVFEASLYTNASGNTGTFLHEFVTQSIIGGVNGSSAMHVYGTQGAGTNQLFTVTFPAGTLTTASTISFDIKGTSSRGLAITFGNPSTVVNSPIGPAANSFNVNLDFTGTAPVNMVLQPSTANMGGSVNTQDEWVRVSIDLNNPAFTTAQLGNLATADRFQIRLGANTVADFLIDNITIGATP